LHRHSTKIPKYTFMNKQQATENEHTTNHEQPINTQQTWKQK